MDEIGMSVLYHIIWSESVSHARAQTMRHSWLANPFTSVNVGRSFLFFNYEQKLKLKWIIILLVTRRRLGQSGGGRKTIVFHFDRIICRKHARNYHCYTVSITDGGDDESYKSTQCCTDNPNYLLRTAYTAPMSCCRMQFSAVKSQNEHFANYKNLRTRCVADVVNIDDDVILLCIFALPGWTFHRSISCEFAQLKCRTTKSKSWTFNFNVRGDVMCWSGDDSGNDEMRESCGCCF